MNGKCCGAGRRRTYQKARNSLLQITLLLLIKIIEVKGARTYNLPIGKGGTRMPSKSLPAITEDLRQCLLGLNSTRQPESPDSHSAPPGFGEGAQEPGVRLRDGELN